MASAAPSRRALALAAVPIVIAGCGGFWKTAGTVVGEIIREAANIPASHLPRTRAERSGYRETSSYADVVGFLDSLQSIGAGIVVSSLGRSTEGREIPYVIASRPLVRTAAAARRLRRPVVFVQANIHAGEVEGKEALLALLRDLAAAPRANVLDSIVLVAIPIYNADGNERLGSQSRNRSEQNGPEVVGERANGQRLDLNRDYVKAEAPETRGALAFFREWDPDVFVDLHTTNGSYHGYALTYSPSLHPAAELTGLTTTGGYARDSLLPELRRRMRARHSFETFDYGNFSLDYGADVNTDTTRQGWYTYDHRARYGTNYYGLRGRVSVLAEGYSHDPFERRVRSVYAFVLEVLSLSAERASSIERLTRASDGALSGRRDRHVVSVPLRAQLTTTPIIGPVVSEDLERTPDSTTVTQPGVPAGLRRTGRFRTLQLPVYDRFELTRTRVLPHAYVLGPGAAEIAARLQAHGISVERTTGPWRARVEAFTVDSVVTAPRAFQGHHEVRLEGRWSERDTTILAGSYLVDTAQPLGILSAILLEPESDDGLATWNAFDRDLQRGALFPVSRVHVPLAVARRALAP